MPQLTVILTAQIGRKPIKKYIVRLSKEERTHLKRLVSSGKGSARMFTRAHVLLKADVGEGGPGWADKKISEAFDVTVQTIERVRKQLVEESFDAVLRRRKYKQKVSLARKSTVMLRPI